MNAPEQQLASLSTVATAAAPGSVVTHARLLADAVAGLVNHDPAQLSAQECVQLLVALGVLKARLESIARAARPAAGDLAGAAPSGNSLRGAEMLVAEETLARARVGAALLLAVWRANGSSLWGPVGGELR